MMKKICILLLFLVTIGQLSAQQTNTQSAITADTAITTVAPTVEKQDENSFVIRVIDWYNHHLNYVTVTMLMALESSFIPFPSEVVVPPAAYQACNPDNAILYATESPFINITLIVLVATLGALIGAFINYYLSRFLGRPIVYWFADSKLGHLLLLDSEKVKKAEDYFIEHGNSSTFVGRLVPGIRQLISIPAGLAKMNIGAFTLYTILGSGSWNIILAVLGYVAHGKQDLINQYSHELSYILLGLGVLFIVYLVYTGLKKKKNRGQVSVDNEQKTKSDTCKL
jgi:membrane protein DedA with SNARE-associated domain